MNKCDGIIDKQYWSQGYTIIGIDEVGRGPVAGPMCFGLVCFTDYNLDSLGLNDSKKLVGKIHSIAEKIKPLCHQRVISIDAQTLNKSNNINDTFDSCAVSAIDSFINDFNLNNVKVLFDGNRQIKNLKQEQFYKPKLDTTSWSVAAASILAKQYQLDYMEALHVQYPQYEFNTHHGYKTAKHTENIKKFGLTPEHRSKWIKI